MNVYIEYAFGFVCIFAVSAAIYAIYRKKVPQALALVHSSYERRVYPDPHKVEEFLFGKRIGFLTALCVAVDIRTLQTLGISFHKEYCDKHGNVIPYDQVFLEQLERFARDVLQFAEDNEGRPERDPRLSLSAPYAYVRLRFFS
ncbi:MAG: hypothetical protein RLZZ308_394 [Candidatus Parcubacteria bacterium]|jgi:hypothetical protein